MNVKCERNKQSSHIGDIVRLEVKQPPNICCLQELYISLKDINMLKVKGLKKIYHENNNHMNEARVALLISSKISKTKIFQEVKRDVS